MVIVALVPGRAKTAEVASREDRHADSDYADDELEAWRCFASCRECGAECAGDFGSPVGVCPCSATPGPRGMLARERSGEEVGQPNSLHRL